MINYTALEAFRASLPESERFETFRFFVVRWDIVKARYLCQATNKPVHTLKVASTARAYGLDRPQSSDSPMYVDEARAMSEAVDTEIPVILALIDGRPLLIDGLHRIYKAYRERKESVPCYALTEEEEQACRC